MPDASHAVPRPPVRDRSLRVPLGAAVWGALLAGGAWSLASAGAVARGDDRTVPGLLWEHFTAARSEIELSFDRPYWTRVGDPIFVQTADQPFVEVGAITAVIGPDGPVLGKHARWGAYAVGARAVLYENAPELGADATVSYYWSDDSVAWILRTMLPESKREAVAERVRAALDEHSDAVFAGLLPIVTASVQDALELLEAELPRVLRAHRAELQALADEYQDELVEKQLLPLVRAEIFPLVERRLAPHARAIGQEIWERVSLWRIGSRALWDRLPLTSGGSLQREWQRVLREEVAPVVESHADTLMRVTQEIVAAAAENPRIQEAVREAIGLVAEDPRVHHLVWSVFREAVVDNERLHAAVLARWSSERARQALALASERLEPTVTAIGRELFGTRGEGITDEFAVVLRNRLLLKDRQWFVLEPGVAPRPEADGALRPLKVQIGSDGADPFSPPRGR